jgi:hypothetical protein
MLKGAGENCIKLGAIPIKSVTGEADPATHLER